MLGSIPSFQIATRNHSFPIAAPGLPAGAGSAFWMEDRSQLSLAAYLPDSERLRSYLAAQGLAPEPSTWATAFQRATQLMQPGGMPSLTELNESLSPPLSPEAYAGFLQQLEESRLGDDPTARVTALSLLLSGFPGQLIEQALGRLGQDHEQGRLDLGERLPTGTALSPPTPSAPSNQSGPSSPSPTPHSTQQPLAELEARVARESEQLSRAEGLVTTYQARAAQAQEQVQSLESRLNILPANDPARAALQGQISQARTLQQQAESASRAARQEASAARTRLEQARAQLQQVRQQLVQGPQAASKANPGQPPDSERRAPNETFVLQFNHPQYNPGGPSSSANCGPASVAMALANTSLLPDELDYTEGGSSPQATIDAVRVAGTGSNDPHAFTSIGQMERAARAYGAETQSIRTMDDIDAALMRGDQVVLAGNPNHPGAYGVGNGINYSGGHFINVTAMDTSYQPPRYVIQDPLSRQGSLVVTQEQLQAYMNAPNATGVEGFSVGNPSDDNAPRLMDSSALGQPGPRTTSTASYPPPTPDSVPANGAMVQPFMGGLPSEVGGLLGAAGLSQVGELLREGDLESAIKLLCQAILQARTRPESTPEAEQLTQVLMLVVGQALGQQLKVAASTRLLVQATLGFDPFTLPSQTMLRGMPGAWQLARQESLR
ncbi:MAG: hypothetical protein AMXMBFR33_58830 [Candidatus Xenobia bacterium]